ncbi:efflux RND transporter periplasmic adaptor subunit [Desulfosediminicola sp.]|uniref:efflux RND transporter periplasmic adaptor subunit n=1 Tax=Desulfosediminicola sp. TaxID=2886825 RepID=UPI003AF2525F
MRTRIKWLILLVLLTLVAGGIWYKTRPKPIEILVAPVERGLVAKTVANTRAGTVKACRRAKLSPSIGGQIALLPIREGDQVKAGELLLEIWNEDLKAQLALAGREVEVAQANANATCFSAGEARRQANREEQLFSRKVGSEEDADRAVTLAKSLEAQCNAAKATVLRSKASVEVARVNLSRTRLIAPFGGVVAQIEGELNEYVTPSPVGVQTPPAVDLIENDCYFVSAPIDEVDAAGVRVGMEVRIGLDAFRGRSFAGKVRRISPYVLDLEKQARTVEIEAAFLKESDFDDLLAGYSADVEIILAISDNTLKIPTEAVIETNGDRKVFVYQPAGDIVNERVVTTGLANWAQTEVTSGLGEDEFIVVNIDKPGLQDGVSVTVVKK